MRASLLALVAALGPAGWHGVTGMDAGHPVRVAYEDTVQRYQGGQSVQRSAAPQRTQPLADGGAPANTGWMA